jgi:hypothetical protein
MLKDKAVESLGQQSLLMPAWITVALNANDRLKLLLTLLQSAKQHAVTPQAKVLDWGKDFRNAGFAELDWVKDFATSAFLEDDALVVSNQPIFFEQLQENLTLMARPVIEGHDPADQSLCDRCEAWHVQLKKFASTDSISSSTVSVLTHGDRSKSDSFHLLVMDLHKRINAIASSISTENINGAHVWALSWPSPRLGWPKSHPQSQPCPPSQVSPCWPHKPTSVNLASWVSSLILIS